MQYRIDQRSRTANRVALERSLVGSAAFRQEMAEDWAPYVLARIPIDDLPDVDDEDENQ